GATAAWGAPAWTVARTACPIRPRGPPPKRSRRGFRGFRGPRVAEHLGELRGELAGAERLGEHRRPEPPQLGEHAVLALGREDDHRQLGAARRSPSGAGEGRTTTRRRLWPAGPAR